MGRSANRPGAPQLRLWGEVTAAYDRLGARYNVIILEGVGSPAEINLKAGDIVNLRMARHAGTPCLLVGDIDRGGVFAALATEVSPTRADKLRSDTQQMSAETVLTKL